MKWRHWKGRAKPQGEDEADESAPPKDDVRSEHETAAMSMDFADEIEQRRRDANDQLASSARPIADQPDDHAQRSEDH
jgi:hypothetical protein